MEEEYVTNLERVCLYKVYDPKDESLCGKCSGFEVDCPNMLQTFYVRAYIKKKEDKNGYNK